MYIWSISHKIRIVAVILGGVFWMLFKLNSFSKLQGKIKSTNLKLTNRLDIMRDYMSKVAPVALHDLSDKELHTLLSKQKALVHSTSKMLEKLKEASQYNNNFTESTLS